jgi:hypothetical protein
MKSGPPSSLRRPAGGRATYSTQAADFGQENHMPLERTSVKYSQRNPPDAIAFWMTINKADPVSPVRAVVTAGALEQL